MTIEKKVTPIGEARWCYTRTTEKINGVDTGKFVANLVLSKKDTAALQKYLKPLAEAVKTDEQFKGKKFAGEPKTGLKEILEDGRGVFKFSTHKKSKNKSGEEFERKVFVFDAKKNNVDAQIGNGSLIKVGFFASPYHMSKDNYGLTLRLLAIQVLELKEYNSGSGNAEDFGFDEEEGYEALAGFDGEEVETSDDEDGEDEDF